jgi:probable HAF family extracellular repeat protein
MTYLYRDLECKDKVINSFKINENFSKFVVFPLLSSMNIIFGKRKIDLIIFIIFISSIVFCITPQLNAQETGIPTLAPLNPQFLKYTQNRRSGRFRNLAIGGSAFGYIPSPLDLSYLINIKPIHGAEVLSHSYDLRTTGKLTSTKDQANCGSCWTFATYGSLESTLLPSETWDFSENNLKDSHGFDLEPCEGGNALMAAAYLARWAGPVKEEDDPYNPSSNVSPPDLTPAGHIQEVIIIPGIENALDDAATRSLKKAVMNFGAILTYIFFDGAYYNANNHTYYRPSTSASVNHAVDIVGWDDNFNKNKFSTVPPGDGAFIVRNSWGTSWGDNGYFYVSYYDTTIGKDNYVFNNAEDISNYSRTYQYDELGWTNSFGYESDTAWFANIFSAVANEKLSAVSFYTATPASTYEIYIYTNITSGPISGTLVASQGGKILFPGYHTILINSDILVTTGQKFSIVVKLTTPLYNYPIPVEQPFAYYSSKATAHAGESYISSTGTYWKDITTTYANTNVCLKAFTSNPDLPVSPMEVIATAGNAQATVSFTAPVSNGGSPITSYRVTSSPGNISATGSCRLITVTGLTNGTAYTFTVTATNATGMGPASAPSNSVTPTKVGINYGIIDIGTLGSDYSLANGINNSSQVVGYSDITDTTSHAFLYSGGVMTDLGTLGSDFSSATGINNAGQVVGYSDVTGNSASHAFLYSGGVMTDLGTLGGHYSQAWGINDAGQVVGYSYIAGNSTYHAFLYSGGVMTDLGTLGGDFSSATGINDAGQVVGYSYIPGHSTWHAFLYSGGVMTDLGTLGGDYSQAWGINDAGQVVGYSDMTGNSTWHAFLYSGGVMTDLGTLGGDYNQAWGINDAGQVVGSDMTGNSTWHPFLLSGGVMTDLNAFLPAGSGWNLIDVYAINDLGQIVGIGTINCESHAFLISPLAVPGAPTGVIATAGNAQATVSFTAPVSNGGSPITSYTVTSSPGGITSTGASSPITITGLTNGTAYTFTVTATNATGTGPLSAPSNSVTPNAVPVTETVSTPSAPSGPTGGTIGISYSYSTGNSSSNLAHSIQYLFDWGDGSNSGWLPVGTTSALHGWGSPGTYLVKARARCATDTSVLSNWSSSINVTCTNIPGKAKILVKPKSLNFGSLKIGSTSNPKTIIIRNTGNVDLIINQLVITGTNASEFNKNDCLTISPGASCSIDVTFAPTLPFGKKSAILSINSNDPKKSIVNVRLSGQAAPPKISVSPKSLNFGSVQVGNISTKMITLKNTGISDLLINNEIFISGTNTGEFSQTNDCSTISTGNLCTINVTFTPISPASSKSAIIIISSNDPKQPMINVKAKGKATGSPIICSYSLSSTTNSLTASGGNFIVTISAPNGCSWRAVSNNNWITITSGGSGSGNGSVAYTVDANTSTSQRNGTMTIAWQTFTVSQAINITDPFSPDDIAVLHNMPTTLVNVNGLMLSDGTNAVEYLQTNDPNFLNNLTISSAKGSASRLYIKSTSLSAKDSIKLLQARMLILGYWLTARELHQFPYDGPNEPMQNGLAYSYGQKDYSIRAYPPAGLCQENKLYGLDCSGLLYQIVSGSGIPVPPTNCETLRGVLLWNGDAIPSSEYNGLIEVYELGEIDTADMLPGDFIFWLNSDGVAKHTGVILSDLSSTLKVYQSNGTAGTGDQGIADCEENSGINRGPRTLSLLSPYWFGGQGVYKAYTILRILPMIDHITITPPSPTVNVGQSLQLTATAYDKDGYVVQTVAQDYTWSASSETVSGTVDSNGFFRAGDTAGKVTVTATHIISKVSGSIVITVTKAACDCCCHATIFGTCSAYLCWPSPVSPAECVGPITHHTSCSCSGSYCVPD